MFLEIAKKAGSIEVICGSMFSGKTEELIRRMKRAQFAKQTVEIYKEKSTELKGEMDTATITNGDFNKQTKVNKT